MKYMDSITKALQSEKTELNDVRVLFDNVIKKYPSLTTYLGAEAEIVHNPSFESALVKSQDRNFEALTDAEQNAAKCLKVQDTVQTPTADDDQEYGNSVELMLKKRKMEKLATQEKCAFKDSRFLLPTSNIIERFFSTAGYAFNDHRQNLTPMNLEMQLFLRMNKDFWDPELVTQIC